MTAKAKKGKVELSKDEREKRRLLKAAKYRELATQYRAANRATKLLKAAKFRQLAEARVRTVVRPYAWLPGGGNRQCYPHTDAEAD